MICDQCRSEMVKVGHQIQPGHPEIWMDAWVCPKTRCPGYATRSHEGSISRWPALTLMGVDIHLCISGAIKFRDGRKPV